MTSNERNSNNTRCEAHVATKQHSTVLLQQDADALVTKLLQQLQTHSRPLGTICVPSTAGERRLLLQAILTQLGPEPLLPPDFHVVMDRLLRSELTGKSITETATLPSLRVDFPGTCYPVADKCVLWKGDITLLRCSAIVNAANSHMLGCFRPFHQCIDNAIHNAAGPRLREECYRIMRAQGVPEATGVAKLTKAYNLPSDYVLHTVGPIVNGSTVTAEQYAMLESCYTACLRTAQTVPAIRSIAFCAISTGMFKFPAEEAAGIALSTISKWLQQRPKAIDRIIFNVWSDRDYAIYAEKITCWP